VEPRVRAIKVAGCKLVATEVSFPRNCTRISLMTEFLMQPIILIVPQHLGRLTNSILIDDLKRCAIILLERTL
jgi:hypothetical protein